MIVPKSFMEDITAEEWEEFTNNRVETNKEKYLYFSIAF